MLPAQFWGLTVREFLIKYRGFLRAENRALWLVGKLALLTQHYKSNPQSPEQLLGYGRHNPMIRYPEKRWLQSR